MNLNNPILRDLPMGMFGHGVRAFIDAFWHVDRDMPAIADHLLKAFAAPEGMTLLAFVEAHGDEECDDEIYEDLDWIESPPILRHLTFQRVAIALIRQWATESLKDAVLVRTLHQFDDLRRAFR